VHSFDKKAKETKKIQKITKSTQKDAKATKNFKNFHDPSCASWLLFLPAKGAMTEKRFFKTPCFLGMPVAYMVILEKRPQSTR